jgi:hypothetical protein
VAERQAEIEPERQTETGAETDRDRGQRDRQIYRDSGPERQIEIQRQRDRQK